MYSFFARRCMAALVLCASGAILTACNGSGAVSLAPIGGAKPTVSPSAVPSTTASAGASPTATATASAAASASASPTPVITAAPSATPTAAATATPTAAATATPSAVASASVVGSSRVDGSNPANTDINASTGATLPSGDSIGLTYYIDGTNATGTAPTLSTYFYLSNPGPFVVTGTVVAAAQGVFDDTPAQLTFASGGSAPTELFFVYNVTNEAQPRLTPNSSFTCSIFDGKTLIGSSTSTVGGSTSGGVTNSFALCAGVYPNNSYGMNASGDAFVNLPPAYNAGDVYTYIISH